jgi:hypothetical protein
MGGKLTLSGLDYYATKMCLIGATLNAVDVAIVRRVILASVFITRPVGTRWGNVEQL